MRGTPRKTVYMTVPNLRTTWVEFSVAGNARPLSPGIRTACESYWQSLNLHGAVMVIDLLSPIGEKAAKRFEPIRCEEPLLTHNIAHRIRDGFLHTRFPLLQTLDGEPHRWATDDPRLVQLVLSNQKEAQ